MFDRNTSHKTIVCKLFVLDRNTWNQANVHKKALRKQLHKKRKYKCTIYAIP